MKRKFQLLGMLVVFSTSLVYSQKIISEKQVELTPTQKKHEPAFSLLNQKTSGVTIFFEPYPAPYIKGEKRKFERYVIQLDKDLNLFSGDFNTLETKFSIRPNLLFNDCSISYYTWVDNRTDTKLNKMMLQIIKYDLDNNITESKAFELCEEKCFDNYRITSYNGSLIIFAQYEKKYVKDKNEKNKTQLVYKRIDIPTLEVKNETELSLLGKDKLGLEAILIDKDKIFIVGPQLSQVDTGIIKIPEKWFILRLNFDGSVEKNSELSIPGNIVGIGSVYLTSYKDVLYMIGEYGDPKDMKKIPSPPYGSSTSISVKSAYPYLGIYLKKLDFDLQEKASATFSYKEDVLPKIKKGNRNFIKKGVNLNFQNFCFLDDGSFYLTAEMYNKVYRTVSTTIDYYDNYSNYTDFNYLDGLIIKFNANEGLEWLLQIERDNYTRVYSGFLKDKKPQENGKLEAFTLPQRKLAILYNTPGRKYSANRFGLSEVLITPQGDITNPYEFTSEQQFELLDGGIIDVGNNEILAIGTNTKTNNLWFKKINIFE